MSTQAQKTHAWNRLLAVAAVEFCCHLFRGLSEGGEQKGGSGQVVDDMQLMAARANGHRGRPLQPSQHRGA
jgi:hypothetical protein